MKNRKDLSLGTFIALEKNHQELHAKKDVVEFVEALEGQTIDSLILGAMTDVALELVHEQMNSYSEEEVKEVNDQLRRVSDDISAKKADIGKVIADKNAEREKYAVKAGLFASSSKSASNSDTEEVSSLVASPITPRM